MSEPVAPSLMMLDLTLDEFDSLYYTNEKLFKSVGNWFYFANDKKPSPLASKGYVRYGRNRARKKSLGFPDDDHGGAVLICMSDGVDPNELREKCIDEKNGIFFFKLDDGTDAHCGMIRDTVGAWGQEGREYVVLIIPNNPQTKKWPYSLKGNTKFSEAGKEEGTLPYFVVMGGIMSVLPDWVKTVLKISQ